jgi:hypothetical protein
MYAATSTTATPQTIMHVLVMFKCQQEQTSGCMPIQAIPE